MDELGSCEHALNYIKHSFIVWTSNAYLFMPKAKLRMLDYYCVMYAVFEPQFAYDGIVHISHGLKCPMAYLECWLNQVKYTIGGYSRGCHYKGMYPNLRHLG